LHSAAPTNAKARGGGVIGDGPSVALTRDFAGSTCRAGNNDRAGDAGIIDLRGRHPFFKAMMAAKRVAAG
jgi:hypothetical protein